MVIKLKDKEVELKFTFNSFKYMRDFDMSKMNDVESRPFEIIPVIEALLLGAMNNSPKLKFSAVEVDEFLEEFLEEGSVVDLLNELMELLQESSFFKSLQRETKMETPAL